MGVCKAVTLGDVVLAELAGWVLLAVALSFTTMEFARHGADLVSVIPTIPLYLTAVGLPLALLSLLPSLLHSNWKSATESKIPRWTKFHTSLISGFFLFVATLSITYMLVAALIKPPFSQTAVLNLVGLGLIILCHATLTMYAVCCVTDQKSKKEEDKMDTENVAIATV